MRRRQKHGDECRRRPLGDRHISIRCCLPASRSHSPYTWPQLNGNAATDERSRPRQDGRGAVVARGITGAFTAEHAATRTTCGDRVFNDANSPCRRHRPHARGSGHRIELETGGPGRHVGKMITYQRLRVSSAHRQTMRLRSGSSCSDRVAGAADAVLSGPRTDEGFDECGNRCLAR